MRDYSKFAPTFWIGETGRRLRAAGRDAQVVAIYLFTGPMSNMIGLYHVPVSLIAEHTGIPFKGASKALQRVCETGFARFEGGLEHVFVPEMAAQQIGEPLKPDDNRVKGIIATWQSYSKSPFYMDFHARYGKSFHLPEPKALPRGFEAPSKPGAGAGAGVRTGTGVEEAAVRHRPFKPPTLEQVREYRDERKALGKPFVDPERFLDHYTANGWVQGRQGKPVVDWKACFRTWEKNNFDSQQARPSSRPSAADVAQQAADAIRERAHE